MDVYGKNISQKEMLFFYNQSQLSQCFAIGIVHTFRTFYSNGNIRKLIYKEEIMQAILPFNLYILVGCFLKC